MKTSWNFQAQQSILCRRGNKKAGLFAERPQNPVLCVSVCLWKRPIALSGFVVRTWPPFLPSKFRKPLQYDAHSLFSPRLSWVFGIESLYICLGTSKVICSSSYLHRRLKLKKTVNRIIRRVVSWNCVLKRPREWRRALNQVKMCKISHKIPKPFGTGSHLASIYPSFP